MSDEEFLKRWSRRKQEAKAATQAPPPALETSKQPPTKLETASEPEFDLSKLPSLDSITAASDVTEFLRKGIPAELSRAALRRAWAADPSIRDFVGLAENAWDFTDPNAIPGFGALESTPEQIGAMVERVFGGMRETAEKLASELPEREQVQQKPDQVTDVSATDALPEAAVVAPQLPEAPAEPVVALQPEASKKEQNDVTIRRRTHGGALPD